MKPTLIVMLVAGLFAPALAQGQEAERPTSGYVGLGVRHTAASANDPSKLNEYRDLESGTLPFGEAELRHRGPNNYFNAYGENVGREDQYLTFTGGRYGTYRFRVYADHLRHNFGSGPGARSPYSGIGGPAITATLPNTNVATWNTFDHSYKRRDLGGFFELQATSPWYVRLDANEVKRDGVNVFAGAKSTSPGGGFIDLPAPIDYTTRNYSVELGHATRRSHFAVNVSHSIFDNEFPELRWTNNGFGGLDRTMLPPDNQLTRLAINGNLRQLPMGSTLAARFTYSRLTNEVEMPASQLSTGGVQAATNPSTPVFQGDISRKTAGLSLSSAVSASIDTRLYVNYEDEKNDSTDIRFSPAVGSGLLGSPNNVLVNCGNVAGATCAPEKYEYIRKTFGAEAGWRVNRPNKLSLGTEYIKSDRHRADFSHTRELKVFGELKNSSLDWATGRVKYQFSNRRSDFELHDSALAANPFELFIRRFDLSNRHQHLLKLGSDATLGSFDVGLEVILKRNDYRDTPLGRTGDERQEYYASVGWGDPSTLRLLVFGDLEYVTYDSRHRVGAGTGDPNAASTLTNFTWTAKNQDTSWQIGAGADWMARPRFKVNTSLIYAQTNGEADFSVAGPAAATPRPAIRNFDNTRRLSLVVKGTYQLSRRFDLTGGYSHERYRYSDVGYDGTRYVAGTPPSESYTTGQFAFQNYNANILFGVARYKF